MKNHMTAVCQVFLEGKDINEDMVRQGYALDYEKYSSEKYKFLMASAKNNKIGIWKALMLSPFCKRHEKDRNCLTDSFYN